ncbi:MAG: AraC family transcriptional regulator [Acetobacteraceae bacterium]|nr:AraC family transcriptional regulator [Acetobacteraceae bacterium]
MERRMIAASFVDEALDSLRRQGLPTAALLAAAGLPVRVTDPISADAYGRLWLGIANAIGDEFFGLGGRPMRPGSFTLLCHCLMNAGTLEAALRRALRFLYVVLDDPRGELVVADGLAQVILHDTGTPRSAFAYRTFWIIVHGITCWFVGRRIGLRRVDFRGPEPKHCADYRLFFGAPVRFEQEVSRLAFDARFLQLPLVRSERALRQFLRNAPANILVRYSYDGGMSAQIRRRLREMPPSLWPGFDELAAQLHQPVTTLRRRLAQEGQSYQSIKDDIRRGLAISRLLVDSTSVGDIAADLGFSEPSAFHRAFRKWTAKSPAQYRRDVRGQ